MTIPSIILPNSRTIGIGHPVYIVAEIGSNHDGELKRAKKLIREAKKTGADAVKFQSFQVHNLMNPSCQSEGSWKPDPDWKILEKLSLPFEWHRELKEEADGVGMDFISTPFDMERLELLLSLKIPAIKIASGDLTYHELLRAAGMSGKAIFLSTGHATLGEVEKGLKILWKTGCKDIVLMHCTSIYPASFSDANVRAITLMQEGFKVQVGYSDHARGGVASLGAVALGACVIEKHLTDDQTRPGPDHPFALDIEQFTLMVTQIRQLEEALSGRVKTPRSGEEEERVMARRAVYAKTRIPSGARITRDLVKMVRHAYPEGIPASSWEKIKGRIAATDIAENELMTWEKIALR